MTPQGGEYGEERAGVDNVVGVGEGEVTERGKAVYDERECCSVGRRVDLSAAGGWG
jgi:hypothetical protein